MSKGYSNSLVLAELEACSFRNKTPQETATHMAPLLLKYMPLAPNSSSSAGAADERLRAERQKDHYSHFILRLAFSSTEELRRRFTRIETSLFRLRFQADDTRERQAFVNSLDFDWETVSEEERRKLAEQLAAASPGLRKNEMEDNWFKIDWERVPELVEGRKVFIHRGKAYVPAREQLSMVLMEFSTRLEKALEVSKH
jgi:DNA primase large subunit